MGPGRTSRAWYFLIPDYYIYNKHFIISPIWLVLQKVEKLRAICGELENQIKDLEVIQVETEAKEVEWENVRYFTILYLSHDM